MGELFVGERRPRRERQNWRRTDRQAWTRRCAPQGNADLVTGSSACAAPFSLGRLRRSKITT